MPINDPSAQLMAAILIDKHPNGDITIEPSVSAEADEWVEALVATAIKSIKDQLQGMQELAEKSGTAAVTQAVTH